MQQQKGSPRSVSLCNKDCDRYSRFKLLLDSASSAVVWNEGAAAVQCWHDVCDGRHLLD